jgi:hypothetical protein
LKTELRKEAEEAEEAELSLFIQRNNEQNIMDSSSI